jgi:hypothetical protein
VTFCSPGPGRLVYSEISKRTHFMCVINPPVGIAGLG